jgi:Transposase DDE domain group 1
MGDSQTDTVRVDFDRKIKLEFHGSTVTSDAGLLAYRELDDALPLTCTAASGLLDTRTGQNTQHSLLALLRQSIYSRLAGYEDVNDAERLCLDPALRAVVGGRAKDTQAASTSEMARFETETLSTTENLKYLMNLSGQWIDQAHQHRKLKKLILDCTLRDFFTPGCRNRRGNWGSPPIMLVSRAPMSPAETRQPPKFPGKPRFRV